MLGTCFSIDPSPYPALQKLQAESSAGNGAGLNRYKYCFLTCGHTMAPWRVIPQVQIPESSRKHRFIQATMNLPNLDTGAVDKSKEFKLSLSKVHPTLDVALLTLRNEEEMEKFERLANPTTSLGGASSSSSSSSFFKAHRLVENSPGGSSSSPLFQKGTQLDSYGFISKGVWRKYGDKNPDEYKDAKEGSTMGNELKQQSRLDPSGEYQGAAECLTVAVDEHHGKLFEGDVASGVSGAPMFYRAGAEAGERGENRKVAAIVTQCDLSHPTARGRVVVWASGAQIHDWLLNGLDKPLDAATKVSDEKLPHV